MTKVKESPPDPCVWDTPAWDASKAKLMTADFMTWFTKGHDLGHQSVPVKTLDDAAIRKLIPDAVIERSSVNVKTTCINNKQVPNPAIEMATLFSFLQPLRMVILTGNGFLNPGVCAYDLASQSICIQYVRGVRKGEAIYECIMLKLDPSHNTATPLGYIGASKLFNL